MTSIITKLLSLTFLACLIASVMCAGPITPCQTATLAVYLAATTPCEFDGLEFSGFGYANGFFPTLPGPSAGNVTVTPSGNGFEFSSEWNAAGTGDGMDSLITYVVTTVSGAPTIDQTIIGMTDTVNSLPLSMEYDQYLCVGEVVTAVGQCPLSDALKLVIQGPTNGYQQTSASFAPVSEITVLDSIFIKSQGPAGSGTIADITNSFPTTTATPEPGTPLLGISGLLVLWLAGKARRWRLR
ncbi:MAG: hypothetical protein ABSH24_13860 [Bryobacteraceae bacterium]|jgi:hypothetical protein